MDIIYLDEVNSTNSYAKENFEKFEDRTVIIAAAQTDGHGRYDRKWVDFGEGNLFMSIVLKPEGEFRQTYACLTQYLSVVLYNILENYGLEPSIKWPNDVLVDGKKIAGILCESVLDKNVFKGLVLGIGVNLNAQKSDFSLVKDRKVTSLNVELGREYEDKNLFTEKLLNAFFKHYDNFLNEGFSLIKDDYVKACKFLGKEITVKVFNDKVSGVAKRIGDCGELILLKNNKEIALTMGDIL